MMTVEPTTGALAIVAAAAAAFVISGVWYALLGDRLAGLHEAHANSAGSPSATDALVEAGRNLAVAGTVAWLASTTDIDSAAEAALLGLVLWIGFPLVILAGSVYHERVPPALAAIHAGDWLWKLLTIAVIIGVWR